MFMVPSEWSSFDGNLPAALQRLTISQFIAVRLWYFKHTINLRNVNFYTTVIWRCKWNYSNWPSSVRRRAGGSSLETVWKYFIACNEIFSNEMNNLAQSRWPQSSYCTYIYDADLSLQNLIYNFFCFFKCKLTRSNSEWSLKSKPYVTVSPISHGGCW